MIKDRMDGAAIYRLPANATITALSETPNAQRGTRNAKRKTQNSELGTRNAQRKNAKRSG